MEDLKYLPYLCAVMWVGYVCLLIIYYYYGKKSIAARPQKEATEAPETTGVTGVTEVAGAIEEELPSSNDAAELLHDEVLDVSLLSNTFANTYKVGFSQETWTWQTYYLFFSRMAFFGLFAVFAVGYNTYIHGVEMLRYFTVFNLIFLSVYFLLTSICSAIGLLYESGDVEWSKHVHRLGSLVRCMFEVGGGSALLVTTVAFTLLHMDLSRWHTVAHIANSSSILHEMICNAMYVRYDHYPYNATWAFIFLNVSWLLAVVAGFGWVYPFLDVSKPTCFAWYIFVVFANFLFYLLWGLLARIKFYFYKDLYWPNRSRGIHDGNHVGAVENPMCPVVKMQGDMDALNEDMWRDREGFHTAI